MQLHIVALVLSTLCGWLAAGQDLSQPPSCATSCLGNSLTNTGCSQLNVTCICNSPDWLCGIMTCVDAGCNSSDQDATIKYAQNICQPVGVNLPTSCASNSTSASSTITPSSPSRSSLSATNAPFSSFGASGVSSIGTQTAVGSYNTSFAASSQHGQGGLSSGAKIGIGVGVTIALIIISSCALILFLISRKQSQHVVAGTAGTAADYPELHDIYFQEKHLAESTRVYPELVEVPATKVATSTVLESVPTLHSGSYANTRSAGSPPDYNMYSESATDQRGAGIQELPAPFSNPSASSDAPTSTSEEVRRLQEERATIQEREKRLLELKELEEAEERLNKRLQDLES